MPQNKKQFLYRSLITIAFSIVIIGGFIVAEVPISKQPQWVAILFVGLLALPTWIGLLKKCGWKKGSTLLLALSMVACILEGIALKTGFPYGHFIYHYTAGFKLFELIPLTVPLAWTTIVIGSYAITSERGLKRAFPAIISIIVCLLVIDLLMDPVMVSLQIWTWIRPGWYYGVPVVNYLGWIGSGAIGASLIYIGTKDSNSSKKYNGLIALGLYLFIFFWLVIALLQGLWIPVLLGIIFLIITRRSLVSLFTIV